MLPAVLSSSAASYDDEAPPHDLGRNNVGYAADHLRDLFLSTLPSGVYPGA